MVSCSQGLEGGLTADDVWCSLTCRGCQCRLFSSPGPGKGCRAFELRTSEALSDIPVYVCGVRLCMSMQVRIRMCVMVCTVYMSSKDMCLLTQRYKFMQLYEQSTKYIFIKGRYRCCTKSATVQDEFQPILAGLISCVGVTGRWERYVMQERYLRVRTCAGASVTCDNYDHSQLGAAAQREAKLPLMCFYLVYGQGQRHRKPPDCIWCKRE